MTTQNKSVDKGLEIAQSLRGYSSIEVLEILTVLLMSVVAAISQNKSYDDILDNGL